MGYGEWTRHVIVNVQPKDKIVDRAVTHLQRKPIREQGQERLAFEMKRLVEQDLGKNDKLYLVGHGGDKTLGGMRPESLAARVFEKVKSVEQINLVMCGTGDITLAKRFASQLCEYGYEGKVYAYGAPVVVGEDGKKSAVVNLTALAIEGFEGDAASTIQGIKGETTVPAGNNKHAFDSDSLLSEIR
jgi:hypothetical protein